MFNVFVNESLKTEEWYTLVHVCRRWRTLIFGSPHYLNLQLLCTSMTLVKKKLDIWPALPIAVEGCGPPPSRIIAVLEHNDRVLKIALRWLEPSPELENLVAVMEKPFPVLTFLSFLLRGETDKMDLIIPDSFLGGSAPRLKHLQLKAFLFLDYLI